MVFRRRKITNRIQTLVDEVVYLLQSHSTNEFQNVHTSAVHASRLENRILMSASPTALVAEAVTAAMESSVSVVDSDQAETSESLLEDQQQDASSDDSEILTSENPDSAFDPQQISGRVDSNDNEAAGPELIVIDYRVQDADTLLERLLNGDRDIRLLRLDSDEDGLLQITNRLEQIGNVSTVHLLTHGRDGEILLGATRLNSVTLSQHAPELLAWQHSLTANADLLIYGCDVAESPEGKDFVESLHKLTGADVAASTDATGSQSFGGNWELEYQLGAIETHGFGSNLIIDDWNDLLGIITVSTTNDVLDGDTSSVAALLASKGADGLISLREAIIATNSSTGADTIILTAGTFALSMGGQDENAAASGDLDITDSLTITGAGSGLSTINASSLDRVFELRGAITATIEDVTIRGGLMAGSDRGGGVLTDTGSTLNLSRVVVTGNSASDGGGIYNQGALTALDTSFAANNANNDGGGFYNDGGTVLLNRVTVSGNTAARDGGGLYSNNNNNNSLSLANVTVSQNSATQNGGGLFTHRDAAVTNSTIAFNDASSGDGIFQQGGSTVFLTNSVLHNTSGVNANQAVTSFGNNIDSDGTAMLTGPNDQIGINPLLDATLQDNGGFVLTHRLLSGSLAIDAGTSASAPTVDARGTSRTGIVDAGAFEFIPALTATGEFQVNQTVGQSQTTSAQTRGSTKALSIMPSGNYAVVWSSSQTTGNDADGSGVLMRIYRSDGTALSGELQVNQTITGHQQWATVSTDNLGNGVVVWTSTGQDDGATSGVYARRFNAAGAFVGNEFRVNTTTAGAQENAVVEMTGSGEFVVAWSGNGPGDSGGVFYRRFDSNGTAADATEKLANGTNRGVELAPAIAINDAGQFAIAWHVGSDLYLRNFAADGTAETADTLVDNILTNAFGAAVGIDSTGHTAVIYRTDGLLGIGAGVWGRTFNADGTERHTTSLIAGGSAETAPSIVMDDDGNFLVVYESSADGAGTGVFMQSYDASFNPLTTADQVNITTTGNQQMPSVAMLNSNNFVVVWSGQGTGDTDGVFARQFHLAPPVLDLDSNDSSGATGSNFNASYVDGGGAAAVVDADAILTDTDTANLQSLKVIITNRQDGSNESLSAVTTGSNITASFSGGVLTLSGSDTVARYQQVLRTVTYNNAQNSATGTFRIITFVANDGLSNSNVGTARLTINAVTNVAPVITSNGGGAIATISVAENATSVATVAANDIDLPSQTLTYSISGGADAAKFSISSTTGMLTFVTAPNFEMPVDSDTNNVYSVAVRVSDGTLSDTQSITVTVINVNDNTPIITSNGGGATAAISITENTSEVTTVTASDADLTAQALTYSISGGADAAKFTIDGTTGTLRFSAAPNFESPADMGAVNVYNIEVQVTDGVFTDTQAIAVTVMPLNDNTPIITSNGGGATAAISITENTSEVTTVTASDADLTAQALTYSISGGADAAKFTIDGTTGTLRFAAAPNFESPADMGAVNVYNVEVQVTDGVFADTQAIAVTVTPLNDNTPVITSNGGGSTAAISVAEDSTAVAIVAAADADSPAQVLVYSISGGADAAAFTINSSTGILRFVAAPDYETPSDVGANGVYRVVVRVSDGTQTDTQAIAVFVTDVNEHPVANGESYAVHEDSSLTIAASGVLANDVDPENDALSAILVSGVSNGSLTLNANGSLVYTPNANFNGSDSFTYLASDGSLNSNVVTVTLNVMAVNDAPVVFLENLPLTYTEQAVPLTIDSALTIHDIDSMNLTGATVKITNGLPSGVDELIFTSMSGITGIFDTVTDMLTFSGTASVADYQTILRSVQFRNISDTPFASIRTVTIRVDDGTNVSTDSRNLQVDAVNDPPTIRIAGSSIAYIEGDPALPIATGLLVSDVDNDQMAGATVRITANFTAGQDHLTFTPSGAISGSFNAATGVLTFTGNGTPSEYQAVLQSVAYQNSGSSPNTQPRTVTFEITDGNIVASDSCIVQITATNQAPTLNPVMLTLAENSPNGTVVATVTSIDPDVVDSSMFSIVDGNSQGAFAIDAATGQISVVNRLALDFESTPVFNLLVSVTDGAGLTGAGTVTVNLTNVNEDPVITSNGGSARGSVNVNEYSTAVTTVTSSDLDGGTAVYSLSGGDDRALFIINSATGVLEFTTAQSFLTPNDANGNNIYNVQVRVTDGYGGFDTQTLRVRLQNVSEAPISTSIASASVVEDSAPFTINVASSFTDPDLDSLTFQITQVTSSTPLFDGFTINAVTGVVSIDLKANAFGTALVTVRATDPNGLFVNEQLTINIQGINDAPVVRNYSDSTVSGQTLISTLPGVLQGATDVEGQTIQAILIQGPAHGTLTLNANGQFIYKPLVGYFGFDSFIYAGSDGTLTSTAATASIDIHAPFAGSGSSGTGSTVSSSGSGSSSGTGSVTSTGNSGNSQGSEASSGTSGTHSAGSTGSQSQAVVSTGGTSPNTTNGNTVIIANGTNQVSATNFQNGDIIAGLMSQNAAIQKGEKLKKDVDASISLDAADRDSARRYSETEGFGRSRDLLNSDWDSRTALTPQELQRQQLYRELAVRAEEQMSFFEEKLTMNTGMEGRVVGSVGVVTTGFSVGYLIWAVRGGMLLSGVLSQIPAWTMLDPLMVIDGDGKDDDKESLQTIVDRQQAKLNTRPRSSEPPSAPPASTS